MRLLLEKRQLFHVLELSDFEYIFDIQHYLFYSISIDSLSLLNSVGCISGLIFVFPCIDELRIVDVRTFYYDIQPQKVFKF